MNSTDVLAALQVDENVTLAYLAALGIAGVLMLVVAAVGFGGTTGQRVINAIVGLVMLGYLGYIFIAQPETIRVFWFVFIVPILLIIQVVKSARNRPQTSE
jgi:hypothetical protein